MHDKNNKKLMNSGVHTNVLINIYNMGDGDGDERGAKNTSLAPGPSPRVMLCLPPTTAI